jgi:MFS family permease
MPSQLKEDVTKKEVFRPWRSQLAHLWGKYPTQFWLMFFGMLISTVGSSMVWPFLMIYVTGQLKLPLTQATTLMALNSGMALASAFIAGPIIDRFGRKWVMVISLLGYGVVYLFYTQANTYAMFALLMALSGLVNPLYRVGGDAMMADLIPPADRPDAYALLRMANNLGISVGPAVGGFLAATSYNYAFLGAAVGMSSYAVLLAIFARETLPAKRKDGAQPVYEEAVGPKVPREPLGGYLTVFSDRPFVFFIVAFTLNQVCAALIWVLLGVYAKTNYGVTENLYGFIPITNALMVVFLQALVTRQTKKFAPLPVLALGSLFYATAVTSVALGRGFGGFWLSMVIMTLGELMLMPTATTYTAALAPADMRGRYMSVFGLTWGVASGIGPVLGGLLSDNLGPTAPWWGGGVAGLMAVSAFVALASWAKSQERKKELVPGD